MKKSVVAIMCFVAVCAFVLPSAVAGEHTFRLEYEYPYNPIGGFILACNGEEVHHFLMNTGTEEFTTDAPLPLRCTLIAIGKDNEATLSSVYKVEQKKATNELQAPTNARIIKSELVIKKITIIK